MCTNQEEVAKRVLNVLEEQIDAQIEKLERIDGDELENLRRKRLESLKNEDKKKREWLNLGHGQYDEIEEREFFNITKKSNVIVHFHLPSTERCQIVDMHFKEMARRHLEVRFVKINAEKSPFITEKLNVSIIPTIIVVKNGQTVDKIIGFTDLGNCDDFSTEMFEWRLAKTDVIDYEGDARYPPEKTKLRQKVKIMAKKKTIRDDSDSSD